MQAMPAQQTELLCLHGYAALLMNIAEAQDMHMGNLFMHVASQG